MSYTTSKMRTLQEYELIKNDKRLIPSQHSMDIYETQQRLDNLFQYEWLAENYPSEINDKDLEYTLYDNF